ncbi:MAG TPA: sugar phosphate isomerase/epimerase family protein [Acidobacteriota bacterium]|nr:sugar phosphate isomerase/epimerase family protein [Acidobacteriota bacterium]
MKTHDSFSRRSFLAMAAAAPLAAAAQQSNRPPVGLELYSVRDDLAKDLMGTVRAVAKMGYQGVEFYSPYFEWTPAFAKDVRKLLDDLNIRCFSTHNDSESFTPGNLPRAIELNQTIGSKFIVMASAGEISSLDGWKKVADTLNRAGEKAKAQGLGVGYHNHELEFKPIGGKRPIEVLASSTTNDVMLQLDVGTCVEVGSDPVAWIEHNPGRIMSIHCKDWSQDQDKGFKVLFGEGAAPWKKIFQAAEKTGGVQYYLIEQEGSDFSELETAKRCLANYRELRAS